MLNEAFDRGIVSVGHLVHETVEVGFLNELGRTVGFTLNGWKEAIETIPVDLFDSFDDGRGRERFLSDCKALGGKVPQNTYRGELVSALADVLMVEEAAPTPPALEGALENSKGGTPEPGTERPVRTLEEKIGADIVARATFALKFAVSGAMSKDHLEAKMLLAGYVLDWGRAPHELYVVCKEGGYRVSASELGIRRSEIEARIAKNSGFDLGSARRQPSPSDSRPGKRKGSAKESAGRTRNTRKANKR